MSKHREEVERAYRDFIVSMWVAGALYVLGIAYICLCT